MRSQESGPSQEAPAPELIESGFALEVADAELLHAGLNLADIALVLVLLEQRVIPEDAAGRLLRLLLEAHATDAGDFPYDPALGDPYNCREGTSPSAWGTTPAGSTRGGRDGRPAALRFASASGAS